MEENFTEIGKQEAISNLFEAFGWKPFQDRNFEVDGRARIVFAAKTLAEGVDFDLTYFPLKHLGWKAVTAATGELYAGLAVPRSLQVVLGVSAKFGFDAVKLLFSGIAAAAQQYGYTGLDLDLVPSINGLNISVSATGVASIVTVKRCPAPKSMDLVAVTGNLGGAYLGMQVLEREKKNFAANAAQPNLEKYRMTVGAYLKPELPAAFVRNLEEAGIYPGRCILVSRGLSDAMLRLRRSTGLGVKAYVEKIPFAGNSFDLGKELDIDPVTAAMNGGDDYRLLLTIPQTALDKFRHDFQTAEIIGHLALPEVGAVLVTPEGVELPVKAQGW